MTVTGADIARAALRAIGAIDPTEPGHAEDLASVVALGTDLLDAWRSEHLTISGTVRSVYPLSDGVQSYTLGVGGVFNQQYVDAIEHWAVIPDDTATHPQEIPRGRPLNAQEWAQIRVKSLSGGWPRYFWFDERYAAGLARCLFHPVPTGSLVSVVLYQKLPVLTSLVQGTTYDLQPAAAKAIKSNLALELAETGAYEIDQATLAKVTGRATRDLARLKRANYRPPRQALNEAFAALGNRRGYNIRTDF